MSLTLLFFFLIDNFIVTLLDQKWTQSKELCSFPSKLYKMQVSKIKIMGGFIFSQEKIIKCLSQETQEFNCIVFVWGEKNEFIALRRVHENDRLTALKSEIFYALVQHEKKLCCYHHILLWRQLSLPADMLITLGLSLGLEEWLVMNHLFFELSWKERGWRDRRTQQCLISPVTFNHAIKTDILVMPWIKPSVNPNQKLSVLSETRTKSILFFWSLNYPNWNCIAHTHTQ